MAKRKKRKKSSKRKSTKKERASGGRLLGRALLAILKIPYYIYLSIKKLIAWIQKRIDTQKQLRKQEETKERRQAMRAKYERFPAVKTYEGDVHDWEDMVYKKESSIGIILGARGTGKSALGIKMLENIHTKTSRKIAAMGFLEKQMPSWIKVVETVEGLPSNSFVLIDEGGILFSSRKSMSDANQVLSELILIARHKNISILFISQNSANLEINILRQADYLLLKPSSLLQIDFERKKIKDIYAEVDEDYEEIKENKAVVYVYSDEFRGFVENPLPSFWSNKLSKSFA